LKIELELSELNEGTESPWWAILNPHQNFEVNERGIHNIASMITGPFFSREEAQRFLSLTRYNFSRHAVVFCFSGYHSRQYREACREAKKPIVKENRDTLKRIVDVCWSWINNGGKAEDKLIGIDNIARAAIEERKKD